MTKNPSLRQPTGPLSVGNVVSAGLRIYRDHFKLYLGLAFKALLWSFIPIYGWAKSFQIQAIISRQVFKELVNQPESVSTTRSNLQQRFWSFWAAQFLIGLMGFAVNMGLSIVAGIIVAIIAVAVSGNSNNPEANLMVVALQNILNLLTLIIYVWFYSHFFIAELPLALETNMNSTNCIGRSWELTKGFVVRIQLIIFLAGFITLPILILALLPVFFLIAPLTGTSPSPEAILLSIGSIIFWIVILATIGNTFMMPFWQAIKAVIYYDIRSRREGLGLQVRDSRPQ
jgi:hypothetical protein